MLSRRQLQALGIALGGSKRVLILFRNSDEEAQRLIHCICIWEGIRDIRLQPDNIAKTLASHTSTHHTR